jgi:GNAT superfamily N-acetyltransferase
VNPGLLKRNPGLKLANAVSVIEDVVRVEDNGDNGLVDLLYVHPEYARRGLGRELLEVGCTWAVARGARQLESAVSIAARPLFEALGFRVEPQVERWQFVDRGSTRPLRCAALGGVPVSQLPHDLPKREQRTLRGGTLLSSKNSWWL